MGLIIFIVSLGLFLSFFVFLASDSEAELVLWLVCFITTITLLFTLVTAFVYDYSDHPIRYSTQTGDISFNVLTTCQSGEKWVVVVKKKDDIDPESVYSFLSDMEPPKSGTVSAVCIEDSYFFVSIPSDTKVESKEVEP